MRYAGGYNCVLAGVYNELTINSGLSFRFEEMVIVPELFKLCCWSHWLTSPPPAEIAASFLGRLGGELAFPDMESMDQALAAAKDATASGKVIVTAINLKYSHFDPTPFDQDFWNFQLIGGFRSFAGEERIEMFDMYHGRLYEIDEARLRSMIGTDFNYRSAGRFTPFMAVRLKDREQAQRLLSLHDERKALLDMIDGYSLDEQIAEGKRWIRRLRAWFAEVPEDRFHEEVYKLMGHLMLIYKSRVQFMEYTRGIGLVHDGDIFLDEVWEAFVHSVPRRLYRRSFEGYASTETVLCELLMREAALLKQIRSRIHLMADTAPADGLHYPIK